MDGIDMIQYFADEDIQNVLDSIDAIKGVVIGMRQKCADMQHKVKEITDEKWKDKQLQSMREELRIAREDTLRGFPITEAELKEVNEWMRQHDTEVHNNPNQYHGASGGGFEYVFYPTGLGTAGDCICGACKRMAIKDHGKDWYRKCNEAGGIFEFQPLS